MPRPTPQPNTTCTACDKAIKVRPCRLTKNKRHFCNVACQLSNPVRWIGYVVANQSKLKLKDMAAHIGMPRNSLRSWIFLYRQWGVVLNFKLAKEPKVKKVKAVKPVKEVKVKKEKAVTLKPLTLKQPPKRKPVQMANRVVDESQLKSVRVNRNTVIIVNKQIPDHTAIERWYAQRA